MTAPVDTVGAFVGPPRVLAEGAPTGPLAGTTCAVKDVIDVAGVVTGAGNPTFARERLPAPAHARAVALLVAAGSTVIGTTITDELAYSLSGTNVHFGTPINVAAPGRVPGGSSAGSAAAVAAGLCDLALGTDTGGSIRVPASYCGLFGWRPTHGAVSVDGVVPLARSFDTVGALTRSAELLVRAAEVLLDARSTGSEPEVVAAVRIVELLEVPDPAARASVRAATRNFVEADDLDLGVDLVAAADAFRALQGREAWAEHGEWITRVGPPMGPGIAARFAAASRVTPAEVAAAESVRDDVRRRVGEATAGGRVLVGPAAVGAAPAVDAAPESRASQRARTLQLTCAAGLAGAPVVVLPIAHDETFPLGVACIGAPGADRQLLEWAARQYVKIDR